MPVIYICPHYILDFVLIPCKTCHSQIFDVPGPILTGLGMIPRPWLYKLHLFSGLISETVCGLITFGSSSGIGRNVFCILSTTSDNNRRTHSALCERQYTKCINEWGGGGSSGFGGFVYKWAATNPASRFNKLAYGTVGFPSNKLWGALHIRFAEIHKYASDRYHMI